MRSCRVFLAILLVVAVLVGAGAVSFSGAEMQHGTPVTDIVMRSTAAANSTSSMCDKCLNKDPAKHACLALCVGVQAAPPHASILRVATRIPRAPLGERHVDGSAIAPDLPPPKLSAHA